MVRNKTLSAMREKKIIPVAKEIDPYLRSRSSVRVLEKIVNTDNHSSVVLDFSEVEFASRGFMDELYNSLLVNGNVTIANMPTNLEYLLHSVKKTQKLSSPKSKKDKVSVKSFDNIDEANKYFEGLLCF